MNNKLTLEQRMAADPDLAEVLDGFEEEMLASIRRGKEKVKAEVGGMSLDRQREVLSEAERRLIQEEKRWLEEAREANRPWIEERRRMGEYHASKKQMHMEAEYWAKQRMVRGNYNPIKLFQDEIEKEIGND